MDATIELDDDSCWRAVASHDVRLDGRFVTAVRTTGIYCRPSCPVQPPKRINVSFYRSAAAAVAAGYRACKRCRPDTAPGSREWDSRGDLAARALRAIGAGRIDEIGVPGLADELHVSERHLNRVLVAEVGAGPLALARTRRAQTARLLLSATDLPATRIAHAAGFGSVRQFNETMVEQFGCAPSELRKRPDKFAAAGQITLRLIHRPPFDTAMTMTWLALHAVEGIETVTKESYRKVLADGSIVDLRPLEANRAWSLQVGIDDVAGIATTVAACRRLLDSDADPEAVDEALSEHSDLALMVKRRPGLRITGCTDPWEQAVRTVIGQQVSLAAARTFTARLVSLFGEPLEHPRDGLTHRFPTAAALAQAESYDGVGLTSARSRTVRSLATAVADGTVDLSPEADRDETCASLLALSGVGPWTVAIIALRALGDPDAWPGSDLILKRALAKTTLDPNQLRPWRGYAAMHLWVDHLEHLDKLGDI